jgi:hypothetical protein
LEVPQLVRDRGEDGIHHLVDEVIFTPEPEVDVHRRLADGGGESPDRQRARPLTVDDRESGSHQPRPAEEKYVVSHGGGEYGWSV